MEQIDMAIILLSLIFLSTLALFIRLGLILNQLQSNQKINCDYNVEHLRQRTELLQTQNEILEQLVSDLQQVKYDVDDIKTVSDVFYKYKLPNKKECEVLDRIAIDNEIADYMNSTK